MRSVKYAILCILLTFAAFFIIETVNKKSVHPFQYALIGLALILFYTLLLSFSEYTGFNVAYIIASVATVGLIAWFVKGILQSVKTYHGFRSDTGTDVFLYFYYTPIAGLLIAVRKHWLVPDSGSNHAFLQKRFNGDIP